MLKKGFCTALGTPLDEEGGVIAESLAKQIEDQIAAGAAGLFLFGTMGMGGCVRDGEYQKGIRAAIRAVNKRCTLLVAASENSLARAAEKLAICEEEGVDGVVMTPPYYFKTGESQLISFFERAASMTKKELYIYDHEPITKHKITYSMLRELSQIPNIKGVKSFDAVLIKTLTNYPVKEDFTAVFSGSDLFDMAYEYGIRHYMDGIFACMPKSVSGVQKCFDAHDFSGARKILSEMMRIRDNMLAYGIWPSFSYAMNLLGYRGSFAPDYEPGIASEAKAAIEAGLAVLGEL